MTPKYAYKIVNKNKDYPVCFGKKSDHNLIALRIDFKQNLFELKNKSSIYQYEFNGGVAQLVRARDS